MTLRKGFTICQYYNMRGGDQKISKKRTNISPLGFCEWNRMPFGLSNSLDTYQRLTEDCLRELNLNICFIFLDDIITFSRTYKKHLDNFQQIFDKLRTGWLKLSPKKCTFFQV